MVFVNDGRILPPEGLQRSGNCFVPRSTPFVGPRRRRPQSCSDFPFLKKEDNEESVWLEGLKMISLGGPFFFLFRKASGSRSIAEYRAGARLPMDVIDLDPRRVLLFTPLKPSITLDDERIDDK